MRKRTSIEVATRREKSNWVDAINPSPAQTISSPDTNVSVFPGSGDPYYDCAGGTPTHRAPCGEVTADLGFGWAPPDQSGEWLFYPNENSPTGTNDSGDPLSLLNFWNLYELPSFPFAEYRADGDPLDYFGGGSSASIRRPLGAYNGHAAQPAPFVVDLFYDGASFRKSSVAMYGLSTYLAENLPYEVLVKFQWTKIADANREPNVLSGGGVTFGYNDAKGFSVNTSGGTLTGRDAFNYQGAELANTVSVGIETKPYQGPGFPSFDNIVVNVAGSVSSSFSYIRNLDGCGGTDMQESAAYYLRTHIEAGLVKTKLWLASEPEPSTWSASQTAPSSFDWSSFLPGFNVNFSEGSRDCDGGGQWDTPCLDFADQSEAMVFHSFIVNPTSPALLDPSDCPDVSTDPGYYYDTLIKRSNFWIPATENVSYYKQIYFNGISVSEGPDYWLDGLKVYPTDPAVFADTVATAEVVIN